jgi:hypothetical protein
MGNIRTFRSMRLLFNREAGDLCECFVVVMMHIDDRFSHLIDCSQAVPVGWQWQTGLGRWAGELPVWAHAINMRVKSSTGADIPALFGLPALFVDGTFRGISRPGSDGGGFFTDMQRWFYTWYKKSHGIVYQIVNAPNGLIVDSFGPEPGKNNGETSALTVGGGCGESRVTQHTHNIILPCLAIG